MTRGDKLAETVRQRPRSVRTDELRRLLESHGFAVRRTGGGHWVAHHPERGLDVHFAEPHGQGDRFVKIGYVRKVLRAIDQLAEAEDD